MKLLSPTQHKRLNEATGFLLLFAGMVTLLSLISYHVQDPSWNTAASSRPLNLIGYPGAYLSDLCLQVFGASAFLFPLLLFGLAWKWIRSDELHAGAMKISGAVLLSLASSTALSFIPLRLFGGTVRMGGTLGLALATSLVGALNLAGALLVTATALVISLYLVSSFALEMTRSWFAGPAAVLRRVALSWRAWRERRRARAIEKARLRAERRALAAKNRADTAQTKRLKKEKSATIAAPPMAAEPDEAPPWQTRETASMDAPAAFEAIADIPICPIEDLAAAPAPALLPLPTELPLAPSEPRRMMYDLPSTELLNEVPGRSSYDEQELKDTAGRIKAKFEEFNVLGNVVQINPGPVVTT
ncbi:MAG TPA: DNA translocase FtsK 4TM domain-containing protein, partial [Bryobacteraceae bacterium]